MTLEWFVVEANFEAVKNRNGAPERVLFEEHDRPGVLRRQEVKSTLTETQWASGSSAALH